jgi:hypothetical protein
MVHWVSIVFFSLSDFALFTRRCNRAGTGAHEHLKKKTKTTVNLLCWCSVFSPRWQFND